MTLVFGYLLLALIPLGAIGYVVWDYRRKVADRNHASAERLHELLGEVRQAPPAAGDSSGQAPDIRSASSPEAAESKVASRPTSSSSTPPSNAIAAPVVATAQARVLSSPQTLVYLLLKTSLPEKIVLARMRLDAVLELPQAERAQLGAFELHFVVAERDMQPLTVVRLEEPNAGSAAATQWAMVRSHLENGGLRVVEFDSTRLPRRDDVAHMVVPSRVATHPLKEPLAS